MRTEMAWQLPGGFGVLPHFQSSGHPPLVLLSSQNQVPLLLLLQPCVLIKRKASHAQLAGTAPLEKAAPALAYCYQDRMKIILTGATGFIGGAVLKQCIATPSISTVFVLTRRDLPKDLSSSPKVKVILHDDFLSGQTPSLSHSKAQKAAFGALAAELRASLMWRQPGKSAWILRWPQRGSSRRCWLLKSAIAGSFTLCSVVVGAPRWIRISDSGC